MFKEQKFLECKHCGNLAGLINDSGVPMICCGELMAALNPNTTDGAAEKHVPVISTDGNSVHINIGSADHPMTNEHHIVWVYLQTKQGGQRKCLNIGDAPNISFALSEGDSVLAAFAFCNLHGLWKAVI